MAAAAPRRRGRSRRRSSTTSTTPTPTSTSISQESRASRSKRIQISFDEWNVWYQSDFHAEQKTEWVVDAVATHDAETGDVTVFVVNRHTTESIDLAVSVNGFAAALEVKESWTLAEDDLMARNTLQEPDRVVPHPTASVKVSDGLLGAALPPVSWTAIRLGVAQPGGPTGT